MAAAAEHAHERLVAPNLAGSIGNSDAGQALINQGLQMQQHAPGSSAAVLKSMLHNWYGYYCKVTQGNEQNDSGSGSGTSHQASGSDGSDSHADASDMDG
jgi:hypothetical protein